MKFNRLNKLMLWLTEPMWLTY